MREIRVFYDHPNRTIPRASILRLVRRVLTGEGVPGIDLSIIFISDRTMLRMNRQFLHHQYQTDVLTFPLERSSSKIEAEIYVNLDQAKRQAAGYAVRFKDEVARLIIHGTLHLTGYRDDSPGRRAKMRKREDQYLSIP